MLKKKILAATLLAVSTVLSAQASAQSFLGGTVGRANWNIDCAGSDACTKNAGGYKLFGGYEYNQTFSVEASYVYLNEVTARVSNISGSVSARGLDLTGVFKTPSYNKFRGFGKIGVSYLKGELGARVGNFSGSESGYSTQAVFGFGALYELDKNVSVRAEFDRHRVRAAALNDMTSNVNMFSIGLQSSF